MYKYRLAKFSPRGVTGLKISCIYGMMLVSKKLVPLADVIVEFANDSSSAIRAVKALLQALLSGKQQYILDEPDIERRMDLLRGHYLLDQLESYDDSRARTALYCHLPWQVYTINRTWQDVLLKPLGKSQLRQLRVRLRRLRSAFSLTKPLLPEAEAAEWADKLKSWSNMLGCAREWDVLLVTCSKLNLRQKELGGGGVPLLTQLLQQHRAQVSASSLKSLRLNGVTAELSDFLLWLYSAPLDKELSKMTLVEFFRYRFDKWGQKLLLLPEQYPDINNPEQLHKMRIKLKRFRYALQSVPELPVKMQLLRSLKYLQDALGLLHDDYINCQLLQQLFLEHQDNEKLRYEEALVSGWEQAKAESAMERMQEQWDGFCSLLAEWQKETVKI